MTKVQFWPADYFADPIAALVLSEPVAGQVRVTWQPARGPDQVELYVRQHSTDWPTLDGTSGGVLDPAYMVGVFYTPSLTLRNSLPTIVPDQSSCVWTNTGYSNGQIVRAIAQPRGQFGYNGARIFNSLTMQNAVGPALFFTGSGYLDDGLEDSIAGAGLDGAQITAFQQITRSAAVSNSTHDIRVEVIDFAGNWINARKRYKLDGSFAVVEPGNGGYDDVDQAATCATINAFLYPYLSWHPPQAPYTHLGMAIKLVPSGGGTPIDMLVAKYFWRTKLS